jgi:hypothetical protein
MDRSEKWGYLPIILVLILSERENCVLVHKVNLASHKGKYILQLCTILQVVILWYIKYLNYTLISCLTKQFSGLEVWTQWFHVCNASHSAGRDQEDCGSRPALTKHQRPPSQWVKLGVMMWVCHPSYPEGIR